MHLELPREQDLLAFDEDAEDSSGPICIEKHSLQEGRWKWSMFAHSTTGCVPFEISGREDSRGDAGWRVVEAYKLLLEHNERYLRGIRDVPSME